MERRLRMMFVVICASSCGEPQPFVGPTRAPTVGQTIALSGGALYVASAEDGTLVVSEPGQARAEKLRVGRRPSRVLAQGDRLYVTLRGERAVAVLETAGGVRSIARVETGAEPLGMTVSPDGARLYVAASASDAIDVVDTARLEVVDRIAVPGQPRYLAMHPSGLSLYVGTLLEGFARVELSSGELERIDVAVSLAGARAPSVTRVSGEPSVSSDGRWIAVPTFTAAELPDWPNVDDFVAEVEVDPADGAPTGAVVQDDPTQGFIGAPSSVTFAPADELIVVSYETADRIVAFPSAAIRRRTGRGVESASAPLGGGFVIDDAGTLHVASLLDPRVRSIALSELARFEPRVTKGAEWSSGLGQLEERGRRSFLASVGSPATGVGMSCGTCHVDGRSDGLVWSVGARRFETRVLTDDVASRPRLGWLAGFSSVAAVALSTSEWLQGHLDAAGAEAIAAYVGTLEAPDYETRGVRTPSVERGERVFEEAGCGSCHAGEAYTDARMVKLGDAAPLSVPTLRGIAASAPYWHDGASKTLEALIAVSGERGMGHPERLDPEEQRDLIAFLRSL